MTYGELTRKIRRLGARLREHGTRHEVWERPNTEYVARIPRHRGEVPTGTPHTTLRELGLTRDDLDNT